jgi:hypothetical protein
MLTCNLRLQHRASGEELGNFHGPTFAMQLQRTTLLIACLLAATFRAAQAVPVTVPAAAAAAPAGAIYEGPQQPTEVRASVLTPPRAASSLIAALIMQH